MLRIISPPTGRTGDILAFLAKALLLCGLIMWVLSVARVLGDGWLKVGMMAMLFALAVVAWLGL